jgi:hypothetical protein
MAVPQKPGSADHPAKAADLDPAAVAVLTKAVLTVESLCPAKKRSTVLTNSSEYRK